MVELLPFILVASLKINWAARLSAALITNLADLNAFKSKTNTKRVCERERERMKRASNTLRHALKQISANNKMNRKLTRTAVSEQEDKCLKWLREMAREIFFSRRMEHEKINPKNLFSSCKIMAIT